MTEAELQQHYDETKHVRFRATMVWSDAEQRCVASYACSECLEINPPAPPDVPWWHGLGMLA